MASVVARPSVCVGGGLGLFDIWVLIEAGLPISMLLVSVKVDGGCALPNESGRPVIASGHERISRGVSVLVVDVLAGVSEGQKEEAKEQLRAHNI